TAYDHRRANPRSSFLVRQVRAKQGDISMRAACSLLTLFVLSPLVARADEKSGLDSEGFVQKWLVLAPIALKSDESGAAGLARQAIKDEAKLKPKAGDKIKSDDKELAWKEHTSKDHLLDFNGHLGAQTEDAIGYAVTFITAPADMKVKMKTGS